MNLNEDSNVLDIGSGLGGPARTIAQECGCHVTGIDLTQAFCDAARQLSKWVNFDSRVMFQQGDATCLPFEDNQFDAAMTIHVAMNIPVKDKMYAEAKRVVNLAVFLLFMTCLKAKVGMCYFQCPGHASPR